MRYYYVVLQKQISESEKELGKATETKLRNARNIKNHKFQEHRKKHIKNSSQLPPAKKHIVFLFFFSFFFEGGGVFVNVIRTVLATHCGYTKFN